MDYIFVNFSELNLTESSRDFYSDFNITNTTNSTVATPRAEEGLHWVYTTGIPVMVIINVVSIVINFRVLASVHWIRRPLSATLYISLSLAAADAYTSALVCLHFLWSAYLPIVLDIKTTDCGGLGIEALRLGGIVTTVLHLTVLACNHYLGIMRPLHLPSIMTHGKTTICLIILWIAPTSYFFIYFIIAPDGLTIVDCPATFLRKQKFRVFFAPFLVVPLVIMTFIYVHILIIVRRQQKTWTKSAERGGSCRHRGTSTRRRTGHQHNHHHHNGGSHQNEHRRHQQMARNIKAVYTTLLILGSFAIGLLPAVFLFFLLCNDCMFQTAPPKEVFWIVNCLVMVKSLANPIIYGARMHEIKEAMRRMQDTPCRHDACGICRICRWCLCSDCCSISGGGASANTTVLGAGGMGYLCRHRRWDEGTDSQQLYNSGGSWRAGGGTRTVVFRLISNGTTTHLSAPSTLPPGRRINNNVIESDNTIL